jgi:hypothetical protein
LTVWLRSRETKLIPLTDRPDFQYSVKSHIYLTLLQIFWRYKTLITTGFNTMGTPPHSAAAAAAAAAVRGVSRGRSIIGWSSEI